MGFEAELVLLYPESRLTEGGRSSRKVWVGQEVIDILLRKA